MSDFTLYTIALLGYCVLAFLRFCVILLLASCLLLLLDIIIVAKFFRRGVNCMSWLLVLGAKSDIARATARRFAIAGFNIYLAARNSDFLDIEIKDLEVRYKIKAMSLEFDVLKTETHKEFYDSIKEKPFAVLCAVGYLGDQRLAEKDFNEAKKIIDTNYTGCVSILNIIADDFEKRGYGYIIGISSVAGDRGRKMNCFYGSSKSAFSAYLSGLRNRLFQKNVRVMTVKPGFVRTKMTEGREIPDLLTAEPEEVASDIFNAYIKHRDILYTKWYWRYIMFIVIHLPEFIFKRMNL
ncbi:MAG: SDR family oxidoreductase [Candidatus Hydrogenedentota bacterium]